MRCIQRMRLSLLLRAWILSTVPSGESSSTKITSHDALVRHCLSLFTNSRILSRSLYVGTIIESSGPGVASQVTPKPARFSSEVFMTVVPGFLIAVTQGKQQRDRSLRRSCASLLATKHNDEASNLWRAYHRTSLVSYNCSAARLCSQPTYFASSHACLYRWDLLPSLV